MQTITARRLLTPIGTVEFPIITVDADGLIEDISSDTSIQSDEILTPTFLDIHTHGCANHAPDGSCGRVDADQAIDTISHVGQHDRHVEAIGADLQNAAIAKENRLNHQCDADGDSRDARPKDDGDQCAKVLEFNERRVTLPAANRRGRG